MAIKQWTGRGGTNGGAVTVANSGGTSGDALDAITLAGAATATYSNTAPLLAGQMSLRLQAAAGGTDRARAYWSFTATDTMSVRFGMRNRVDPGTANGLFSFIIGGTFGIAGSLALTTVGGARHLILQDAAAATLLDLGAVTFGATFGDIFIVDMYAVKGTTASNGQLACRLYNEAGTLLTEFPLATNVNLGTAQWVRVQWGGNTGVAQDLEVMAMRASSDAPAKFQELPTANVAPTATIMARPAPQAAGTVTVTGTITDSNGTITAASVAIVSGPNNPTVSVATSGLNSATANVSGTFAAQPGRYVVSVSGTDSAGLASNVPTQTIDVFPPDGTPGSPELLLAGTYTTVGGGSAREVLVDGLTTTYRESPEGPTGQSERWRLNPIGGRVLLYLESYQNPPSPTVTVTGTFYREDGTTVIESFPPRPAPTAVGAYLDFTLSAANQAALSDPINKRALVFEWAATQ